MKVILYMPDFTSRTSCSGMATRALSRGLERLGVEHTLTETKKWRGEIADVAIVNGWLKTSIEMADRPTRCDIIRAQAEAGKPAWCLERGFVGDREEWSSLAIGGFCATGGDFRAEAMPSDRWERLVELGETPDLKPWREPQATDVILICAQVPWDAQVEDEDHFEWLERTAREIRRHTDLPVQFRGHPKAWRKARPYEKLSQEFRDICGLGESISKPITDFHDDLTRARAVFAFNSNTATLCLIEGVPVFTGSGSNADPIAIREDWWAHNLRGGWIEPPETRRRQWAADLAYRQWHVDEFEQALPWQHLTR